MSRKKKTAKDKPARATAKKPEEQPITDTEALKRFHSLQDIGKQIIVVDRKLTAARKDEDDAKEQLRIAKENIKSLVNEREDMVAEQVMISQGKFSERLAFPMPPDAPLVKDFELRDRLKLVGDAVMNIPDATFDTVEYNRL